MLFDKARPTDRTSKSSLKVAFPIIGLEASEDRVGFLGEGQALGALQGLAAKGTKEFYFLISVLDSTVVPDVIPGDPPPS